MATKKRKATQTHKSRFWVAKVKTNSTHPPEGFFTKDAATIARSLASKRISPKGPDSGMRMLNYFINRAGSGLSRSRKAELQTAKGLLSRRIQRLKRRDQKESRLKVVPVYSDPLWGIPE